MMKYVFGSMPTQQLKQPPEIDAFPLKAYNRNYILNNVRSQAKKAER